MEELRKDKGCHLVLSGPNSRGFPLSTAADVLSREVGAGELRNGLPGAVRYAGVCAKGSVLEFEKMPLFSADLRAELAFSGSLGAPELRATELSSSCGVQHGPFQHPQCLCDLTADGPPGLQPSLYLPTE